jgi:hypothetical protein
MTISKAELARVRQVAEEFIHLTEHGDSDFATMARYAELSAHLALGSLALVDEIERLQRDAPKPHMLKMDRTRGFA